MSKDIVLIGPIGVGKSTLSDLLAKQLGVQTCALDDIWLNYAGEIGFDVEFAKRLQEKGGFWASYIYRKEFCCYAVERILSEHCDCVFDFGAGHSVYEIDTLFARVQRVLAPYRNVVLILPTSVRSESIRLLEKVRPDMPPDIKEHFVTHHSNYDLAKFTIYIEGKSPEETRDEILDVVTL